MFLHHSLRQFPYPYPIALTTLRPLFIDLILPIAPPYHRSLRHSALNLQVDLQIPASCSLQVLERGLFRMQQGNAVVAVRHFLPACW